MIHVRVNHDSNGKCTVEYICIEPPEDEDALKIFDNPKISYRYKQHLDDRFDMRRTSRFYHFPLHLPRKRKKTKPFEPFDNQDTDPDPPE